MTITQLEYILAVHKEKSFSDAATVCQVTQPTLSMQIHKLEEELGVLIFDRSRKPIQTTEIGLALVAEARELIDKAHAIQNLTEEYQEGLQGTVRMAVIPTVSSYMLPFLVPHFDNQTTLDVHLQETTTEDIIRRLKDDELDVGIMATPLDEPGLREIPLYNEKMLVYCSEGHPLLKKRFVLPEDLSGKDVWLLEHGHCWRNQVLNLCQQLESENSRSLHFTSGSLDTIIRMVDRHNGYTLIPEMGTYYFNEDQMERVRYFEERNPGRQISLVVRRTYMKKRLLEYIRETVIQAVPPNLVENRVEALDID